jgi:hypothetical protein
MPVSGADWVAKFPTSKSLDDLEAGFKAKVQAFIDALHLAHASTTISATFRPRQRGYLMHFCWMIVKQNMNPASVPDFQPKPGEDPIDIQWLHRKGDGSSDVPASRAAAAAMVAGYGIGDLEVAPALDGNHMHGKAIDMSASWAGNLSIKEKSGNARVITSTPRNSTNADLIHVAATYQVIHFINVQKDKAHWSVDGH